MKNIIYILLFPSLIYAQDNTNISNISSNKLICSFQCGAVLYSGNALLDHRNFSREGVFAAFNFFTKKEISKKVNIISRSSFSVSNAIAKEIDIIIPETNIEFRTKIPNILACNNNYLISIIKQINSFLYHGISLQFRVFTLFYKKGELFNNELHSLGGFISSEENGSLPDLEKATQISYAINCGLREEMSINVSFFLNTDWKIIHFNTHQIYPGIAIKFEKIINRNFHPPWIRRVNK